MNVSEGVGSKKHVTNFLVLKLVSYLIFSLSTLRSGIHVGSEYVGGGEGRKFGFASKYFWQSCHIYFITYLGNSAMYQLCRFHLKK